MGVAEDQPLLGGATAKQPRTWRNGLFTLWGGCEATDAAACCLSYHAPCVAMGEACGGGEGKGAPFSAAPGLRRFPT